MTSNKKIEEGLEHIRNAEKRYDYLIVITNCLSNII